MKQAVITRDVPHCITPQCNGLVKPDIVFFGEQLPENFHKNRALPGAADLCIIMGTSLSVQPFASLPGFCAEGVPRILINLERVGGIGSRADDVILLEECDSGVRRLAAALGWEDELDALWQKTNPEPEINDENTIKAPKTKNEILDDQIKSLTEEVDESLKITDQHTTWLRKHLAEKQLRISDIDKVASNAASISKKDTAAEDSRTTGKGSVQSTDHSEELTPQQVMSTNEMKASEGPGAQADEGNTQLTGISRPSL